MAINRRSFVQHVLMVLGASGAATSPKAAGLRVPSDAQSTVAAWQNGAASAVSGYIRRSPRDQWPNR